MTSTTLGGGLARRVCDLFWPVAAEAAGFAHPDQPPVFLSLETSQYYMAHIVRPLLDEGYFESVTMDRNRMYSQILDNLNKAAIVGFPILKLPPAWMLLILVTLPSAVSMRMHRNARPLPRVLPAKQPA